MDVQGSGRGGGTPRCLDVNSAQPQTAVLQVFKSGIAQSLELVDSMTEDQKVEAWKTVVSLFEQKAKFSLREVDVPSTKPKARAKGPSKFSTSSADALDAGNALLLLTEASMKRQQQRAPQVPHASSHISGDDAAPDVNKTNTDLLVNVVGQAGLSCEESVSERGHCATAVASRTRARTESLHSQQGLRFKSLGSPAAKTEGLCSAKWTAVFLPEKEESKSVTIPSRRTSQSGVTTRPKRISHRLQDKATKSAAGVREATLTATNSQTSDEGNNSDQSRVSQFIAKMSDEQTNDGGNTNQPDHNVGALEVESQVTVETEIAHEHFEEPAAIEEQERLAVGETKFVALPAEKTVVPAKPVSDLDHAYHSGMSEDQEVPSDFHRREVCAVCKTSISTTDIKEHHRSHGTTCPVCQKQTSSLGNLIRHVREVHDSVRPFPCQHCDKGFFKREQLSKHMKSEHDSTVEAEEKRYHCDECEKHFSTLCALNVHKEKHRIDREQADPFACEHCGRTFGYKANLKRHERIHTGDKKHVCSLCPKKFIERKSLVNHMYKEHNVAMKGFEKLLKTFECAECHKQYSSAAAIQAHMVAHSGVKPNVCLLCGQKFGTRTALQRHSLLHSGVKRFECEVCGRRFAEKGSLQNHSRIHTNERPFRCSLCDKSFRQRSTLLNHMPVHKPEERNFLCILCGKSFLRRSHYNFHMKKHSTNPTHKCQSCEAAFYRQTDLDRHEATHSGLKPFNCDVCGKKFSRSTYLRDHLNIHKGVRPHGCRFCTETFYDAGSRARHVRSVHGCAEGAEDHTDVQGEPEEAAVYVQAGDQVIKIDLASQRGEHLTEMVNVRELRDGDGSSAAGETLEQATVTHQETGQNVVHLGEEDETSSSTKHQLSVTVDEPQRHPTTASEILKLVNLSEECLANPEDEGAQELHIQMETQGEDTGNVVVYVKPDTFTPE